MRITMSIMALTLGALSGCSDPHPTRAIELSGTIDAPADAAPGTVHVTVFHEWELQGELRHPRGEIVSFETKPGPFTYQLSYPEGRGEGLLVYAWIDSDGDGVHCTPSVRNELAGLAVAKEFPADEVVVDVRLTEPCRGPDWFYP